MKSQRRGDTLPNNYMSTGTNALTENKAEDSKSSYLISFLDSTDRKIRCELKHLRDVIAKNKLEMLQDNGSIVFESIIRIYSVIRPYIYPFENSPSIHLQFALTNLCQALANLIELCDAVMLKEDAQEVLSQHNVECITKNLHQAVKKVTSAVLTKLINEKNEELCTEQSIKKCLKLTRRSHTLPAREKDHNVISLSKSIDSPGVLKTIHRNSSFKDTFLEKISSISIRNSKDTTMPSPKISDNLEEKHYAINPAIDLEVLIKQVRFGLKHLSDVILKQTLGMLNDNCNIVLNTVTQIQTVIEPYISQSAHVLSSENRLFHATIELRRMCDNIKEGDCNIIAKILSPEIVTREVQNAVEELASIAFKQMANRTRGEFQEKTTDLNLTSTADVPSSTTPYEEIRKEETPKNAQYKNCFDEIADNSYISKQKRERQKMSTPELEPQNDYLKENMDRNSAHSSYSTSSQALTESDIASVHSDPSIESFEHANDNANFSSDSNRLSHDARSSLSLEDDDYSTVIDFKNNNDDDINITASHDEIDNISSPKLRTPIVKHLSPQDDQCITYREHDDKDEKCALSPRVQKFVAFTFPPPPFETKQMSKNTTHSVTTYLDMFGKFNNSLSEPLRHSEPVFNTVHSPVNNITLKPVTVLKDVNEEETVSVCDNIQNNKVQKTNTDSDINISLAKQNFEQSIDINECKTPNEDNTDQKIHPIIITTASNSKNNLENEISSDKDLYTGGEIKHATITRQEAFDDVGIKDIDGGALMNGRTDAARYNCNDIRVDQNKLIIPVKVDDSYIQSPRMSSPAITKEECSKPKNINVSKISIEIQKQMNSIKLKSKTPPPVPIRRCQLSRAIEKLDHHSLNLDESCNKHKMQKQENFSDSRDMDSQNETTMELDLIAEMDVSPWLIFKNISEYGPNIKGGHQDALIVYGIESTKGSRHYEAFLATYCTFVTPVNLIEKIIRRHSMHISQGRITMSRELLNLLMRVIEELPLAELTSELLRIVTKFIHGLICFEDLLVAKNLRQLLIDKTKKKQLVQQSPAVSNVEWNFLTPNRKETVLDYNTEAIAEQITLLDAELFAKLPDSELLYWARNQCQSRCPNLAIFTEHFNKLSFWVTSRILEQFEVRDREKYTTKFIRIMKHLRKINNFSSMTAILLALNSTVIGRLNYQNTIMDGLEEYMALIDDSYNFKACRQALSEAQPPCIPHIAMTLKDLTALHNGCPSILSDGNINFSKHWQQYIILDSIKRLRKMEYTYKRNDSIMAMFTNFEKIFDENTMWNMSYHIKPRG